MRQLDDDNTVTIRNVPLLAPDEALMIVITRPTSALDRPLRPVTVMRVD